MKTNPHAKSLTWQPCNSHHLILVDEGVQCSNCLALVIDRRTPSTDANKDKADVAHRATPV